MTKLSPTPLPPCNRASAIRNQDFICVETLSGYALAFRDPETRQYLFPLDISDLSLGEALQAALAASRFMPPETAKYYREPNASKLRYEEWYRNITSKFSYKTKSSLYKNMISCYIEEINGTIKISPSHHEKLDLWINLSKDGSSDITVPSGSSPEEIGAALQLAFRRCTGPGALGE